MRFVVIGILLAFLAGAIYVGHYGWVSAGDVAMPAWGWLMMGLGVFFTVVRRRYT
jgi:MYXO-CTERM domain-containing protein